MKEKIYNAIAGAGINIMSSVFPEYFAKEPLRPTDRYIEYPYVIEHLPKPPAKVLDVGCSGSMFPLLMKAMGYDVYGIDIRPYPNPNFHFIQGNICNTKFPDYSFDVVTAVSTIEHIGLTGRYGAKKEDSDTKALTEILRILRPDGNLIMTVPYGKEYIVGKYHRIYNREKLEILLTGFSYNHKVMDSPEGDYKLALIFARK